MMSTQEIIHKQEVQTLHFPLLSSKHTQLPKRSGGFRDQIERHKGGLELDTDDSPSSRK